MRFKFPAKIPIFLALFLIAFVVGGLTLSFEFISRGVTQATPSVIPMNAATTNVSDNSFTVVWQTDSPTKGSVIVTSAQGKKFTAFDERDVTGKMEAYLTHSVTVRSLSADTEYTYSILINGKASPALKAIKTGPSLTRSAAVLDPAFGTVVARDQQSAEGALILLTLPGSQTVSTLVKPSGTWVIPLSTLRTEDATAYFPTADRTDETIIIRLGTLQSDIQTDTLNDSPVPTVILGQVYDFRNQQSKKNTPAVIAKASPMPVKSVLGVQTEKAATPSVNPTTSPSIAVSTKQQTVSITSPKQKGSLVSALPLIQGTGIPNKKAVITLGVISPTIYSIIIGKDGLWSMTPNKKLAAGKQSVTLSTVDAKNKPIAITHDFIILKSGTQVLGDATPSATIEPTITEAPIATVVADPMPETGSTLPTIMVICMGFGFLIAGTSILVRKS